MTKAKDNPIDALPLSARGTPLSRNGLSRNDAGMTPRSLLADVKEELCGINGLVAMLECYVEADDLVKTEQGGMGCYRLCAHIYDQLKAVDALLGLLHGVLPESFDQVK